MFKVIKNITISKHISTTTYHIDSNPFAISFITDLKNRIEYVLKGKIAILWEFIVQTLDYDLIREFAVKNQLENILDDFLSQLKEINLIETDLKFPSYKTNYFNQHMNFNNKDYNYFLKSKRKFCENHKFIEILTLDLTYKCNLTCKHCCSPQAKDDCEITYEQAKKIIDDFCGFGINQVFMTGGECTLNKDFLKIAKYVRSKHLNLFISTNGQKLYDDENLFNELIKIYPYSIQLSLYSTNPDIHDNMTGVKGSYNKTLSVIKKIKKNNISAGISNFVSKYNKTSANDLKKLAKELNVSYTDTCLFINNPENNNFEVELCEKDIENFYYNLAQYSSTYKKFEKNDESLCTAGITRIAIAPNLDIIPCLYNRHILGNYNTTSIKELKEKILPEYRKIFTSNNLTECFKYDYCKYCSYCSTLAVFNEGFMKKSEILCTNARAMQKAFLKYEQLKKAET